MNQQSMRQAGDQVKIGIIGGSGLYKMEALKDVEEVQIDTPFGSPSDALIVGTVEGTKVAFLARHGRNHTLMPSELPFRANIYAMKSLGVEYLISASAVGSLRAEVKPLDMVVPDQFIDRTKNSHLYFLWQRHRWAYCLWRANLPQAGRSADRCDRLAGFGGCDSAPRRHLRLYGRACFLDQSRIKSLPKLGRDRLLA